MALLRLLLNCALKAGLFQSSLKSSTYVLKELLLSWSWQMHCLAVSIWIESPKCYLNLLRNFGKLFKTGSLVSMSGNAHLAMKSIKRWRMKETLNLSVGNSPGRGPMNTLHWARNVLILSDYPVNLSRMQMGVVGMNTPGTGSCAWAGGTDDCGAVEFLIESGSVFAASVVEDWLQNSPFCLLCCLGICW